MRTLDTPLGFTDTHRHDADVQPSLIDALEALCDGRCPPEGHAAMCPANPDPQVCDGCAEVYDPEAVTTDPECPGGHCADPACLCWACHRSPTRLRAAGVL